MNPSIVYVMAFTASTALYAHAQSTEYGQLFLNTNSSQQVKTQEIKRPKVDESLARMQASIAPATFEDYENSLRAKALAIQKHNEQAEKVLLAEKMVQANKPTVIVVQQPMLEPTFSSAVFALPGAILRALAR
jgi:wyosine [tRNA(Phe)-imidazoG37] synthetase (radical SAM superfamily)